MGFYIDKPSAPLAPYVKSYWGMEHRVLRGREYSHRIVPNGMAELIFYLGDLPESLDPGKHITERVILSGQQKEFYDIRISGRLSLFSIIFQPHGLMVFFDIPLSEIFNLNVPLKYILKDNVSKLETELFEINSMSGRKKIIEDFLLSRYRESMKKYEYERIQHCIEIINQNMGLVDIDVLASKACLSRKQFERTFQDYVGTTPKIFLRTVRFQSAVHEKSKRQNLSITELSHQCGYFDQSHMTGEFNKLAGMTPKKYFTYCEPYSDYFQ